MKSVVIYYSQTGSTRKIAQAIHRGIIETNEQCDLTAIKDVTPRDLDHYDLIGLGSPIWMGAEPPNVRIWIESLPKQQGKHIFSFNTHGVMPELYFPAVVRRLNTKGFAVIGMRDWYGDYYSQTAPRPYFTDGHPDEIDLKEAEDFGREMVSISKRIRAGEANLIPLEPKQVLTPQLLVLVEFYRSGHNPHGLLKYHPEKCNYPKCRLCMDHCLMNYIDLSVSPRVFGSNKTECDMWMGCTFCEMICPTGAISCDWEAFVERFSASMPANPSDHPLQKAADAAIASGRLRLLVPKEKIRWDRLYYQVYNKHPRFKIPKDE